MGLIITEMQKRHPGLPYFDESFTGDYPEEAPFTISELEQIYPYASGYAKEHEDYREEALKATFELQNGRRGYRSLLLAHEGEPIRGPSDTEGLAQQQYQHIHFAQRETEREREREDRKSTRLSSSH